MQFSALFIGSVVISSLEKIDTVILHSIDQPMFFRKASRPSIGYQILERFWFAQLLKWITEDVFDEIEGPQGYFGILANPIG